MEIAGFYIVCNLATQCWEAPTCFPIGTVNSNFISAAAKFAKVPPFECLYTSFSDVHGGELSENAFREKEIWFIR
jgi:hypothetical protein